MTDERLLAIYLTGMASGISTALHHTTLLDDQAAFGIAAQICKRAYDDPAVRAEILAAIHADPSEEPRVVPLRVNLGGGAS